MRRMLIKFLIVFFITVISVGGICQIVSLKRLIKLNYELITKTQDMENDIKIINDNNIDYEERVSYLESKVGEISQEYLNYELEETKSSIKNDTYKLKLLQNKYMNEMNQCFIKMNTVKYMRDQMLYYTYIIVIVVVFLFGAVTIKLNRKWNTVLTYLIYFILLLTINTLYFYVSAVLNCMQEFTFSFFDVGQTALLVFIMFVLNMLYSLIEGHIKNKKVSKNYKNTAL